MPITLDAVAGAASVLASIFLLALFVPAFRNPDRSKWLDNFGPVEMATVLVTFLFAFGWGFVIKGAFLNPTLTGLIETLLVSAGIVAGSVVIWKGLRVHAKLQAYEAEVARRALTMIQGGPPPRPVTTGQQNRPHRKKAA